MRVESYIECWYKNSQLGPGNWNINALIHVCKLVLNTLNIQQVKIRKSIFAPKMKILKKEFNYRGLLRLKKCPEPSGRGSTFSTFLTLPSSLQRVSKLSLAYQLPPQSVNYHYQAFRCIILIHVKFPIPRIKTWPA